MLNLFLALLLSSFGQLSTNDDDDEEGGIKEAINRIKRFFRFLANSIKELLRCKNKPKKSKSTYTNASNRELKSSTTANEIDLSIIPSLDTDIEKVAETQIDEPVETDKLNPSKPGLMLLADLDLGIPTLKESQEIFLPPDCCSPGIYNIFFKKMDPNSELCRKWTRFRSITLQIIEHDYFEFFIIIMIIISSAALVNILFLID